MDRESVMNAPMGITTIQPVPSAIVTKEALRMAFVTKTMELVFAKKDLEVTDVTSVFLDGSTFPIANLATVLTWDRLPKSVIL